MQSGERNHPLRPSAAEARRPLPLPLAGEGWGEGVARWTAGGSLRLALAAAMCFGATGCASVKEASQSIQQAMTPAAAGNAALPPAAAITTPDAQPPVSPDAQQAFDHARRALRAGRTDEAERAFRTLTQSHPDLGGPHANLGVIHRQAGKLPEAVAALEKAVALSPRQPLYFNQLGVTYRQAGQFAKAREAYDQALALDPNYADATLNLAILHDLYLWDGQRALALYDRYLALSPAGDATVTKWVADLKNRKQHVGMLTRKEKE
ncbi:Lipoprotein NlpI [Burkholderiaceae bacterium]|nr:Lipoprotein NlpI [Burkholderiaceae bacterium]